MILNLWLVIEAKYYLKDHLGNIRVTIDEDGEVVTTDDYYPFGLQMPGRSYNVAFSGNQYKYNSKEWDDENNLNTYHYGMREYDPVTARFNRVDRFADNYYSLSPYSYGANNPIIFIDVNGDSLNLFDQNAASISVSGEGKLGGVKADAKVGPVEVGVNLTVVEGTAGVSSNGTVTGTGKVGTVGFNVGVGSAKVDANGSVATGKVSVGPNGASANGTVLSGSAKLQVGAVNASAKGSIIPQAGSVTMGTDNTAVNISNFDISASVSIGPVKMQGTFNPVIGGAQAGAIAIHAARAQAGTNKYPAGPATMLINKLLGK